MKLITKFLGIASLFVSASILVDAVQNSAIAQVTANPNDAGTVVNQNGDTFTITGGTQVDKNVFHSLQKFGLNENQIADFVTNSGTENILGRISGGDASVINGLIKVTGSNANLYLMNQAGIIFGKDASLDVPGSFHATTASGIGFEDNWFKAFGENDYASLVGNPDSFAFTQSGTILNSGDLEVKQGQSLTLSGGNVISTGTLKAPGGNITIKTVPEDNLVTIRQSGDLLSLGFPKSLPVETKTIVNNQPFTPLSLPQLLTGGNLNNATGVEVENGVVKLTASGTEIPDKAGTIVVANNLNTEGETRGKTDISSVSGNIILGGLNELLNFSGDVIIEAYRGEIVLDGNIISLGDITIGYCCSGETTLGGNKTTKTVESIAGDITFSQFNQEINSDSGQSYDLNLIAKKGDIEFDVSNTSNISKSTLLNNLSLDAKNITFVQELSSSKKNLIGVKAKNHIDVTASNDIGIETNLKSNGDIDLEAGRNITNNASKILDARIDTNIIAANKVEIRDSDTRPAIITTGGDLLIQGNKRINIQAFKNDESIFKSGNKLTLLSDGEIAGNTKFESAGDFDIRTLEGSKGNFNQTFTPSTDTIISSEGDVNFGNYEGLSLKIEAKGSIAGGDITINGSNPNLTGSDPDIELLNKVPKLVLRAGVEKLENKTNLPSQKVGGTNFTSSGKSSSADIIVGDIKSDSATISATGNINTGHIRTRDTDYYERENFEDLLLQATGDITVKTISSVHVRSNIKTNAGGLFRVTESFLRDGSGSTSNSLSGKKINGLIPTSISVSGFQGSIVSIQHGGRNFIIGPKFETDVTNTDVTLVDKEGIGTPLNENNIDKFTSFTAGAITYVGRNGGPMSSFRDSALDSNDNETISVGSDSPEFGEIQITSKSPEITQNTSLESSNNTLPETVENNVPGSTEQQPNPNQQSTSNQQPNPEQKISSNPQPIPESETVQRQLTKKEQDEICSRKKSTAAVKRTEKTRGENAVNNSPCKGTNNDDKNILKVIPDNRFNDSTALPNIRVR